MKKSFDKHLLGSLLILLLVFVLLFFAVKFLYSITKFAQKPDQEKIKSQVIQFDMENYQKLEKRFKMD